MISWLRRLAILPLLALATRAAAQEESTAPPCDGPATDAAPCRARYDTAPVLDPASEPPLAAGEVMKPLVWIYVDETGAVRRAQLDHPTRHDWDMAARDRALQFRFRPAVLEGRAVAAWIAMPVPAVPPPASCAGSSPVPLSGGAMLADSTVSGRPGGGTVYRYAARGFPIDLFVYPHAEGETPRGEVEKTLAALRQGAVQGGPDSIAVVRAGEERIRPGGRFREVEFAGYGAVYRASLAGSWMESYAAVFPAGGEDLKIRATYPRDGAGRRQVAEFVQQILSHRAYRMRGCPR